jgi:1,4-dihydroxy-6-naphthoate synthase
MKTTQTIPIRFGHSPDPDDAFMFYAFAKNKIDMQGFRVEHVIEDIESLNQRALKGELEVTAVSCHAYAYLADKYLVMRSGASVGDNYGPIIVGPGNAPVEGLRGKRIAIPGKLTTAYLALQLYEKVFTPVFMPFDKIMGAVRNGEADYGLVIHEGQITFTEHGLKKVLDLGEWWHEKTRLPLPLGIDIIRRDLGIETIAAFSKLFKESIEYALNHRKDALEYAGQFGRGISEDLNDRFVAMYVNDRTVDLGTDGEAGFRKLLEEAYRAGIIPKKVGLEFI